MTDDVPFSSQPTPPAGATEAASQSTQRSEALVPFDVSPASPDPPAPSPNAGPGIAHAFAAAEGAMEGFTQGIEEHGLPQATHRAIDQVDRLAASVRRGTAAPERPSALARRLHEATNQATVKVHQAQDAMDGVLADVKLKAHGVAETGRRAAAAPPVLARDVGQAAGAYAGGVARQAGWLSGAGLAGLFALVLVTIAAAAWLTTRIGLGGATLVLGVVYGIGAFACMGAAKAARKRADAKARVHLAAANAHLKHVAEPMRTAFQR
jgi:hypothetical protein